jgi:predicted CoA-binding protein
MRFTNPPITAIDELLRSARIVAVVGLSDNPHRPSYDVAYELQDHGYRIVPVSPKLAVWEGIRAVPDLDHVNEVLGPGERVDIVNVFRQSQHVDEIVSACIRNQLPTIWMQVGVIDEAAAQRALAAGLTVVMDRCIKVDRLRMG